MRRSPLRAAALQAAILCWVSAPAAAFDVLEGLAPADFRISGLAGTELRALAEPAPLDAADWIAAANPLARTSGGGPTLTDVGVATVASEVAIDEGPRKDALSAASAVDLRILATPGLRDALEDVLDTGGTLDLPGLLEDLGEGDLGEVVPLEDVLEEGLLDLPTDELQDLLDQLGDDVLGGLLGGLGGGRRP